MVRLGGHAHAGWLPPDAATPRDTPVIQAHLDLEITDDGAGHYLLSYCAQDAEISGDTWHATLDEAFEQASRQFGIARGEWAGK
jgi:hypothetical protein